MSFADDYTLTRSSIFKTLVGLFLFIAVVNMVVLRQVYIDSDEFHRLQLTKQLNDEIMEFRFVAAQGKGEVERLLQTKQTTNTPFYFHLQEQADRVYSGNFYPIVTLPKNHKTFIPIGESHQIEIGVDPETVEAFRQSLIPIVLSGIILPIAVMLVAALFFTLVIQKRIEVINKAMNRVLCGERGVKIAVSEQDDEFDVIAIHLNFMIEQMALNEASLKSLTVGMAHDMRTPMARLKLRLEDMLSQADISDDHQNQLAICHDELELILSSFNSMLEIAKLNSGQLSIQTELVDLGKIAQDALEFISPVADQKQLTLCFREDQHCSIMGDRSLLFRAVFNLIENSVKYTPIHGEVSVVIDQFGVVVVDSGIGISDADKLNVCRPMYRADKSRSEQGNGLGLSLVDAVVKRHHAKLIFRDNNPGLRARIYVDH
ncbi:HAMP domain-containing sensor histidine kinase [Vibrio sp. YMD68]|uniref:sensor histidine kinase n=1 Tax=Vibrio sp. YMD68 TaxID=3042300 RepID=UPI00249C376E|nr:HAMP domain-containing sensor histidine kinase [Vibrio sp. YMD68]WGV98895.1 HAMP domain-containing sensor histidine kinase [Vibrio sp. YMD68]